MKDMKKTVALAALMSVAAGGAAYATEGWYGRVDAGYNVDGSMDFDSVTDVAGTFGGDTDLDGAVMGSGGVGYAFSNGFRLEGELSLRDNDLDVTDTVDQGGSVKAQALMANLYYDFNRGGWLEPYLGVGVGVAKLHVEAQDNSSVALVDDTSTKAAYQALAGVAVGLSPQLDLDIGYRYFAVPDADFDGLMYPDGARSFGGDYTHQAVTVGLRWQFAAPAVAAPPTPVEAPPPAPVATCPQSDFVVYFEWDRSALNAQALEVIDNAVARARECNISAATLVGHTDTSGTPAYNVALSQRRASVVADALVARGLAASLITTQAVGETDLARPTADGVREPLNRRTAVTITFQ